MTDIKQALENLLAIIYEDDGDYFIKGPAEQVITRARETLAKDSPYELQDFTCSISSNIDGVTSYYVAAKYFLAELRNDQPKTVVVTDRSGNEFIVNLKE